MTCEHVKLPGGGHAIVCGRSKKKPCCFEGCKLPPVRLCDWKVTGKRSGTCDKPVCAFHAYEPPGHPDKDLCPEHGREWKRHLAAKASKP